MLDSMYAVHSENSWSSHSEIELDDIALCSAMMMELWTRQRDEGCRWECYGGYKRIWEICGTTRIIECRTPRIAVITHISDVCCIRNCKLASTRNSLKFHFLMMICPISTLLYHSHPKLYHHLRTQSALILQNLSRWWPRVNTQYSIHRLHHTLSTAYTKYSIHQVQHTKRTGSSEDQLSRTSSQCLTTW